MNAILVAVVALLAASESWELRAGVARKVITPDRPIWMSGYAARTRPSEGVVHDLWAKALALQDAQGERLVVVTADLIGLPREITDEVAARAKKRYGLARRQLLFNAAHTHGGPHIKPNLEIICDGIKPGDHQRLVEYQKRLIDDLVEVVGAALADLSPATLANGHGSVAFGINRRENTDAGVQLGVNVHGPVDHDVPVLTVATPDGKPRAVLFGYACHNTTLGGDCYQLHGDYAGFAQIELEKALPGTTAMFLMLCGADQNPGPRGSFELAARHGKTLADEVRRVMADALRPVGGPIRARYEDAKLTLAPQDRAVFEREARGSDRFRRRRAEAVLAALDAGSDVWHVSAPVQAIALGKGPVLVAIGGEVVVDYSLRLKREYPGTDLIVAGYSNDVMCYIPSRRMLAEGGYEVVDSMIYYGKPGPFAPSVEETLVGACRRLLAEVGVKPSGASEPAK
jgi:neutral ceramidase